MTPELIAEYRQIVQENLGLLAEVKRLKKAIESFGNGTDFDWNVLGRIDELECTLGDEEAAHQDTLRLWNESKAEVERLRLLVRTIVAQGQFTEEQRAEFFKLAKIEN